MATFLPGLFIIIESRPRALGYYALHSAIRLSVMLHIYVILWDYTYQWRNWVGIQYIKAYFDVGRVTLCIWKPSSSTDHHRLPL